ncbi:MAG: glycosyltransferase [Bacilli bacterium]|uniref:glycosyltransferase family 2 protein n=1 Tax=Anaerorhabdus sp. TaxID=1872524 RepID=UPI002FC9C926
MEFKYSIIIPSYNADKYLDRSISSVINQTYKNFEVIIIDDGSTDNSYQKMKEYASKYDYIKLISQDNYGLGHARNVGITEAKGEYILFLDCDDWIEKEALERIDKSLNCDCDLLIFDVNLITSKGEKKGYLKGIEFYRESTSTRELIVNAIPAAWNKVYKRKMIIESNVKFPEGLYYEDLAFSKQIFLYTFNVFYLKEPLYNYVSNANSMIHTKQMDNCFNMIEIIEIIITKYREMNFYNEYTSELEFVMIMHLLIYSTLRVNSINPFSNRQYLFLKYMKINYPEFRFNKYIKQFDNEYRKIFEFIIKKQYLHLWLYRRLGNKEGN